MKLISGKGWYLWQLQQCGAPQQIADEAHLNGVSHLLVKVANGVAPYNGDGVKQLVEACQPYGIDVWGWHYLYHNEPVVEAALVIRRINETGVTGYVFDCESECKGKSTQASQFSHLVRDSVGRDFPLALSSYRFPSLHTELPWSAYRSVTNMDIPQVYWEQAHNAGAQLNRSILEYTRLSPRLPYLPTGATYKWNGWKPTLDDVISFLDAVRTNGLPGMNFWEWSLCKRDLPEIWSYLSPLIYNPAPPPVPSLIMVDTAVLNMRMRPNGPIIDQTQQGDVWPVAGVEYDEQGRPWYQVRASVAGWLVKGQ